MKDFKNTYQYLYYFLKLVKYPISLFSIYLGLSFFNEVVYVLIIDIPSYIVVTVSVFLLLIIETIKYISVGISVKSILNKNSNYLFILISIVFFSLSILSSITGSNNIKNKHLERNSAVKDSLATSNINSLRGYYDSIIASKTEHLNTYIKTAEQENIFYYKVVQDRINSLDTSISRLESKKEKALSSAMTTKLGHTESSITNKTQITVFFTEMFLIFCLYFQSWYIHQINGIKNNTPLTVQVRNKVELNAIIKTDKVDKEDRLRLILDTYNSIKETNPSRMDIVRILENRVSRATIFRDLKKLEKEKKVSF